jgi:hypothetical protein
MPLLVYCAGPYSFDAIMATYRFFVPINLNAGFCKMPAELSARGLPDQMFNDLVMRVKNIKTRSDSNKAALWTSCILFAAVLDGY